MFKPVRKFLSIFLSIFIWGVMVCAICSCGGGGDNFRVKGSFKNLNQGEFYVYSPDGVIAKIDTIHVDKGNFVYTTPCEDPGTLVLVFPNFTELPLFAQPGKTVKIEGDVTTLQDLVISGTPANELMSAFRHDIAGVSPPEQMRKAEAFIREHPESEAAVYILSRYFLQSPTADYAKAQQLCQTIAAKQPKSVDLARLQHKASLLAKSAKGSPIPDFTATDCLGRPVTKAALLAVVLAG